MKILVDGVFYQLARTGIARVWSAILPRLASCSDLEIALLDRGACPPFDGIERVEFPSYTWTNTPADSFLIDRFCQDLRADIFISTYYTTPVTIPSILMVYDMIPEVLELDLGQRAWQEKQIAVSFASYYGCISENTRQDLLRFYPAIDPDRVAVTHCGVEQKIFWPRESAQVEGFKARYALTKPYYLLVGSREQVSGYKNATLLFEAAYSTRLSEFEILCAGGESEIAADVLARRPPNVSARRMELTDDELACAYSGAEALVFPSLYEGFGMPVIEAMACGCPVITTKFGSLAEVAGDAALFISGRDPQELQQAMSTVRDPAHRQRLVEAGLKRAVLYSWDDMTTKVHGLLKRAYSERESVGLKSFLADWERLRSLQAEVDVGL